MGDLLKFQPRPAEADGKPGSIPANDAGEDRSPENILTGPAKCLACGHEWVAENIPTGDTVFDLVCPSCDTRRGQLQYPPCLSEDMITWAHDCGSIWYTPVFVDPDGYILRRDDLAKLNTGGRDVAELQFCCHGCGELISPDEIK